jgi:homoserine kinase type II
MAVFTPVEPRELEQWLCQFDIGAVREFRGIHAGIENSNYFVTTDRGAFVLTLFERLDASELPFYLELMRHLSARQVACPAPVASSAGALFLPLCGKPAALVTRLPGVGLQAPSPSQCASAGGALARLHLAGRDFALSQPNLRGLDWWRETTPRVLPFLTPSQGRLLQDELAFQIKHLAPLQKALPKGPIHADLFRDNALFVGESLGGFIDFYFAACDLWLFDVAVTVNDWCASPESGEPLIEKARSLLGAYASLRPFTPAEARAWPILLRAAALRFWLSRLADLHLPRPAELLTPHDPARFERLLRLRREAGGSAMPVLPG